MDNMNDQELGQQVKAIALTLCRLSRAHSPSPSIDLSKFVVPEDDRVDEIEQKVDTMASELHAHSSTVATLEQRVEAMSQEVLYFRQVLSGCARILGSPHEP